MAIIKAVNSRASISNTINYITKKEKTEYNLISGINCFPDCAITQMQLTKTLWNKTDGRQYKHIIQSFPPDEDITLDEAHKIAKELIQSWGKLKGYEIIFATHKDRKHIHTHIVINSVSFESGKKFRYSKKELQDLKDLSDQILEKYNKSICQKNDEITSYNKNKYKVLEKSIAQNKYKSYVYDCYKAVMNIKKQAISRLDFIDKMKQQGYETVWSENRKYITFIDKNGNKIRNSNLQKTFKEPLDKEVLENEFKKVSERNRIAELQFSIGRDYATRQYERINREIEQRKSITDSEYPEIRTKFENSRNTINNNAKRNVKKRSSDREL